MTASVADRFWRVRHLPLLLGVCGVVLVAATATGLAVRGWPGAAGAAAGVGIVTASYLLSTVMIAWAASIDVKLVLPWGMAAYITKFTLIGLLMTSVPADWPGLVPLGWGVVVSVVAWTGAQIWWVVRSRQASEG